MAKNDAGWTIFRRELKRHMATSKMTSKQLAETIGESESAVSAWRLEGRGAPRLAQLPDIAKALRMGANAHRDYDPLFLPRAMGIVSETKPEAVADVVDLADRLQKLELKMTRAQDRAADLGQREGWAAITRVALRGGRWAVASWPVTEGPAECRLRVADRIDIARTDTADRRPLTAEEVWADQEMRDALRAARAVQASRDPRWATFTTAPVSCWSVGHTGVPMSPTVNIAYEGAPSLAFTASTVDSWVNDVACLVALAIGYGQSTTRDMAMEIFGERPHALTDEHQLQVHGRFLQRPTERRCWSHHSSLGPDWRNLFEAPVGATNPHILHVWHDEDDDLLNEWLTRSESSPTWSRRRMSWNQVVEHREANRAAAQGREDVLVLPTRQTSRVEDRWSQVLSHVAQVLQYGRLRNLWPADLHAVRARNAQQRPALAGPLNAWLEGQGL